MKTVLIILTTSNLLQFKSNESVALAMLLATFGHHVRVLLKQDALSLLQHELSFHAKTQPFKPASNMVDSFEFYDLYPILIEEKDQQSHWLKDSIHQIQHIKFNPEFLNQFDHVLYY